jgi:hypothetical protein
LSFLHKERTLNKNKKTNNTKPSYEDMMNCGGEEKVELWIKEVAR